MKFSLAFLVFEGGDGSLLSPEQIGTSECCGKEGGVRTCAFATPGNATKKTRVKRYEAITYWRFTESFLHRPIWRYLNPSALLEKACGIAALPGKWEDETAVGKFD